MEKTLLKEQVCAVLNMMGPELRKISLALHEKPELGGEERFAASILSHAAKQRGFRVEMGSSGYDTAFVAQKGSGSLKIGFLAEYDALPELGHACGHNLIAAMSYGAAAALAEVAGDKAVACLIGCPAEETSGAKVAMTEHGVFDDLAAAMIVHPADGNYIGGTSYATHPVQVTYRGRSAHVASQSDRGINALDALITFYQRVRTLTASFSERTIVAGIITKGGTAPNIVPAVAEAKFTVRAESAAYLENFVLPALRQLAGEVAAVSGATVEVAHYEPLFKELINDGRLMELYMQNMELMGEKIIQLSPDAADGSTDVGNVSHVVPTIHPDLGIGSGLIAHTPAFAKAAGSRCAQERLLVGAKAMAMTAIDLLPE